MKQGRILPSLVTLAAIARVPAKRQNYSPTLPAKDMDTSSSSTSVLFVVPIDW